MTMKRIAAILLLLTIATAAWAQQTPQPTGLRGPTPIDQELPQPPIPAEVNDDVRRGRAYPEQPPVIPHSIRNYELSLTANQCLTCHGRQFTQQSQAPMISVTHYQDRDGNFLGGLAPRRYACLACHVPQTTAQPLVENRFTDMDALTEPDRRGR